MTEESYTWSRVRHRIDGQMRPGLWLGRDFPMRRFSRQDIPLQSQVFDIKGQTRPRHNARPNIDLPTHAKYCHIWGRQLSHPHTPLLRLPQVLSPHLL